jgi:peroxiredoxin
MDDNTESGRTTKKPLMRLFLILIGLGAVILGGAAFAIVSGSADEGTPIADSNPTLSTELSSTPTSTTPETEIPTENPALTPTPIPTAKPYFFYGSRKIPSVVPAQVNYPAPKLELIDTNGAPVSLGDYRGRFLLVNTWATWCPFCEAEMPELETYYQVHGGDEFSIIAIAAGDSVADVQAFTQGHELTFSMWLDPKSKVFRAFRNNHLPSSYVIDKKGNVRLAWNGPISYGMLEQYLTPLLEE